MGQREHVARHFLIRSLSPCAKRDSPSLENSDLQGLEWYIHSLRTFGDKESMRWAGSPSPHHPLHAQWMGNGRNCQNAWIYRRWSYFPQVILSSFKREGSVTFCDPVSTLLMWGEAMGQRQETTDLPQVSLEGVTLWEQFCNFLVCEIEKTAGSLCELSQIVGRMSRMSERCDVKEEGLDSIPAGRS